MQLVNACPKLMDLDSRTQEVDVYKVAKKPLTRLSAYKKVFYLFNYINITIHGLPLTRNLTHLDVYNENFGSVFYPSDFVRFQNLTHVALRINSRCSYSVESALVTIDSLLQREAPDYATLKIMVVRYWWDSEEEPMPLIDDSYLDLRVVEINEADDIVMYDRLKSDGMLDIWGRADEIIHQRLQNFRS